MQNFLNWRLEKDSDQIVWLYFDKKNVSVNTMDREVMEELARVFDYLENEVNITGVVITSAKKSGFIAGADISQFNKFKDVTDSTNLLRQVQQIFDRIEAFKKPVVALIDGFCLGGGLELALSCHYRIAEESNKTRLGFPEVKLGIHPGWGGSVRMVRLIGPLQGLNLVLSGHTVSGRAAAKLGFVDVAVPKRQLVHAARYYILNKPPRHTASYLQNLLNTALLRKPLAAMLRRKLRAKVNITHYPAPFDVVKNWEEVGVLSNDAFIREAETCGRLFFSETSHNLVRVFYLQEKLKNIPKDTNFVPNHVHVIGAGTMGGDIAAWCAIQGLKVTLQDREAKFIAPAIKRAYQTCKEKLKENHLIQQAMDRLIPDIHGHGIAHADVIIEAIFENLPAKQALFKELESKAKKDAILATNTSSIPLDEINSVLNEPQRLVGIHFFNPVAKMLLVEVVKGNVTDQSIIAKAISFVRKIDRLPLPVKSSPGFLVNRILMPYLLESLALLEEGYSINAIDRAMVDFGMPMGPVTLADAVGLDICLSVANYLGKYFNAPIPSRLTELVAQGKLGRKTGEGFYRYKNGKQIKVPENTTSSIKEQIVNRLVLRMLDESFATLREKVVANKDLLDAGMIFATGFAPFTGGPMHYANSKGVNELFREYARQRQAKGDKYESLMPWEEAVGE